MENINKILNRTVDLLINDNIKITGSFQKPNNNIWFIGRMKYEFIEEIRNLNWFKLTGKIGSKQIHIENAYIAGSNIDGFEPEFITVDIFLQEVILNQFSEINLDKITSASISLDELNWFYNKFLSSDLYHSDNSHIVKENKLNMDPIKYDNKELILNRYPSLQYENNILTFKSNNIVIFNYKDKVNITEVLRDISSFRIFISFLADHFISFPYLFEYKTNKSYVHGEFEMFDNLVYMNDNRKNQPIEINNNFRIVYSNIKEKFSNIWKNWNVFFNESSNRPMIKLFHEIISNKSTGLNRFLNVIQALEVYSNQYRNKMCDSLVKKEFEEGTTRDKRITLRIRIKDILIKQKELLDYENQDLNEISEEVSLLRNYYTHYNPIKQKEIEEKFDDVDTAFLKYDSIVYFLLLSIVYEEIGIPNIVIKESLSNPNTRFGKSLKEIYDAPK